MPAKRRLLNLFSQVQMCNSANVSDCLRMFSLSRELIESNNQFDKYPTLRLFSDWSLHPKLDRRSAKVLLDQIAKIVDKHQSDDPTKIIIGISKVLSIPELHSELLLLFKASELPDFMLRQPEIWNQCVTWLLQDLTGKPVIGSKHTDEEIKTGWGIIPRELKLIEEKNQIKWEVTCGPRVILKGLLVKLVQKSA